MWYGSYIHPAKAQHTPTREVVKIPDVFVSIPQCNNEYSLPLYIYNTYASY